MGVDESGRRPGHASIGDFLATPGAGADRVDKERGWYVIVVAAVLVIGTLVVMTAGWVKPVIALGAAIRRSRLARGISQEELAHRSAIDRSYMSSIERGGQNPGIVSVARIASAMEMSMTELMAEAAL